MMVTEAFDLTNHRAGHRKLIKGVTTTVKDVAGKAKGVAKDVAGRAKNVDMDVTEKAKDVAGGSGRQSEGCGWQKADIRDQRGC